MADLAVGTVLDAVVLGERLGAGGMGTVHAGWLTRPSGLSAPVAVKVLDPAADLDSAERLVREACIGGLASHPNVVRALDLGRAHDRWYIVMELVEGISAGDLVARGALPTAPAMDLVAQAAAGLAYLHALDTDIGPLVHGDVKPQNLLVDGGGRVRVADFGVAVASGSPAARGTWAYMAPEQWQGASLQASDVFALGLVLYRLLFGAPLVRSTPDEPTVLGIAGILVQRRVHARADARVAGLGSLLVAMLALDPDERPSAGEVADQLRRQVLKRRGVSLASLVRPTTAPADPTVLPPLLGRSELVEALARRVARPGLLGVTGPTGVGKTRLVQELSGVAAWIPLAGVGCVSDLFQAVARGLDVPLPPQVDTHWIPRVLRDRGLGRVVFDAADGVLEPLLAAFSSVPLTSSVVVTTRRRPDSIEVFEVPPLDSVAAMELYIARSGGFAADHVLEELVARLDHLPLAIELAASSGSPPARLLADLALPFGVLRETGGTGAETLYAALDVSWRLLSDPERRVLMSLSVFRGRPRLDDVVPVLGAAGGLAEVLSLIDRHLVVPHGDRIGLLSSVRTFTERKALADPDRALVRGRHVTVFAQRGSDAALARLKHTDGGAHFTALLDDEPDLDAALATAVRDGLPEAGPLALAKVALLVRQGPMDDAVTLVDRVVPLLDDASVASALRERQARVLERQGRNRQALTIATRAYRTAPARAKGVRADCRLRAGLCLLRLGRVEEARRVMRAALADARRAGDAFRAGEVHLNLSLVAARFGDRAEEVFHQEEARRLAEATSYRLLAGLVLGNIATRRSHAGDVAGAIADFETALAHLEAAGDRISFHNTRAGLAGLLALQGRQEEAAELFGSVLAACRTQRHHAATARYACLLADVEVDRGRPAAARTLLAEALSFGVGFPDNDLVRRLVEARLLCREGRHDDALVLLHVRPGTSAALLATASLERAAIHLDRDRPGEALREAEAVLSGPVPRAHVRATALLRRARAARALGRDDHDDGLDVVEAHVLSIESTPRAPLRRELETFRAAWAAPPSPRPAGR